MALSITHTFVSSIADGTDATVVRPSNWNAGHTLTGIASAAQGGTGLSTAVAGDTLYASAADTWAALAKGTALQVLRMNAGATAPEWATAGAGALSGITAATGANTIASGTNSGQVWNWALTADSVVAMTHGETTAATGGTSTAGVPNQIISKFITLAASTASSASFWSRGAHVMSISPTTAQIVATDGSESAPSYSFASGLGYGVYKVGNVVATTANGSDYFRADAGGDKTRVRALSATQFLTDIANGDSGLFWPSAGVVAVTIGGGGAQETLRWTRGVSQFSFAAASAVSYALNFRKSRGGDVASPTVITTADVLMTISAAAYLGATNTYMETGRIEIKSKGTISDATNGVGSVVTLYGKTQGTDVTVVPTLVITDGSTASIKFAGTGMFTANATTACALTAVGPAGASTTVQTWLTVTDSAGTVRYIPCF